MQDIGIWVVFLTVPTSNNLVSGNTVTGSGLDGIQISSDADGNTVTRNSVVHNGFGQVLGVRDGDGIVVFGNGNLVQANQSVKNAAKGIRVFNGSHNRILSNVAVGNGTGRNSASVAFDLADTTTSPPCDSNVWLHNVFVTFNQPCVTH
jgi:parallel beta-helix repeat protein